MKKVIKGLIVLCSFVVSVASAQETQFSQFFATSAFLNPAYVGISGSATLDLNYKTPLGDGVNSLNSLMHATVSMPIQRVTTLASNAAGVGLTFVKESRGYEGVHQITNVLLAGSYNIPLSYSGQSFISLGLQGGVIQNKLDNDQLQFGSQYNPYLGYDSSLPSASLQNANRIVPTFNTGAILHINDHHNPILSKKSLWMGVSAHSVNRPKYGFYDMDRKPIQVKLFMVSRIRAATKASLHPSAYLLKYGEAYQVNAGLYLSRYLDRQLTSVLQIGSWYRVNDSFIFLVGLKHQQWKAGVSVDLNSQTFNSNEIVTGNTIATYEISFSYNFSLRNVIVDVTNPLF